MLSVLVVTALLLHAKTARLCRGKGPHMHLLYRQYIQHGRKLSKAWQMSVWRQDGPTGQPLKLRVGMRRRQMQSLLVRPAATVGL